MKAFSYKMAANSDIELNISGVIGDGWSEDPVTAEAIRKVLKDNPKTQNIKAHIDSSGGSFFEGLAIYQLLADHPANVDVTIGARAASAASLIAMAGDSISMHETSTMLIHPVWTIAMGNAEEMRKVANDLDTLSGASVKAYAARTGMSDEATTALLNEDRYMTADEALKMGFCTVVRKAKGKGEPTKALSEKELRSEVEQMRTSAQASLRTLRMAASAPSVQPDPSSGGSNSPKEPPVPSAPASNSNEEKHMNLALLAAALGLPEGATETDVSNKIAQLKASTEACAGLLAMLKVETPQAALGVVGALQSNEANADSEGYARVLEGLGAKNSEGAMGKIAALNDAKERLAVLETEAADASAKRTQDERASIVQKLKDDGKLTPAQEEATWFKSLTIEGLKAFAETAVPVLKGDGRKQARSTSLASKKWEDMTTEEQRQLHDSDPAAFDAAYSEYNARNR
ncbi:MAG: head maturation protease, ClpP-related [Bryobacteraceae bacterium]